MLSDPPLLPPEGHASLDGERARQPGHIDVAVVVQRRVELVRSGFTVEKARLAGETIAGRNALQRSVLAFMPAIHDRQVQLSRVVCFVTETACARVVVVAIAEDGSVPIGEYRSDVGRRRGHLRMRPGPCVRIGIVEPAIGLQVVRQVGPSVGQQRQMPDAGVSPFAYPVTAEWLSWIGLSRRAVRGQGAAIRAYPEIARADVWPAAIGLTSV